VVAAKKEVAVTVLQLEAQEEKKHIQGMMTLINIVAHEQIAPQISAVGIRRWTSETE
jgi:hypothetical protein